MGDILKEVEANDKKMHRGPIGCVEQIARDHADMLADALAAVRSTYPASSVARVLKSRGVDISDYTVLRHRRGDCRCPEELR